MQLLKMLVLAIASAAIGGCANSATAPSAITLVLPAALRGEIFLIDDARKGQDWKGGEIVVPRSGIVAVRDLAGLGKIKPGRFGARYSDGRKLGNSVLRTGNEVSLWPLDNVNDELLYFVVGTFHEKTDRENERMVGNWQDVIAQIRAKLLSPSLSR